MAGAQIDDFRFLLENLKFLIYLIIFLISISKALIEQVEGKFLKTQYFLESWFILQKFNLNKDGIR